VDCVPEPARPDQHRHHPGSPRGRGEAASTSGTATGAAGATWSLTAINETAMTVSIFTVLTVTALTLTKIARGDTHTPR
jgi:hypothetical protein